MSPEAAVRALVGLSVLIFGGLGIWMLIDPGGALAEVGVSPTDARGEVELRAMYGGLELGIAAFLAWSLTTPERARTGLVAATCGIGGLGLIRTATWPLYQPEGGLMLFLCAIELTGAAVGAGVLWWSRPR